MSDGDAIARKLDFMRSDIEEPGSSPAARLIAGDAARLLAAVEAVLKEADDFEANRPERLVTRRYAAECFRAAITRGLTGKEAGDVQA
jgi:hypothetical protein